MKIEKVGFVRLDADGKPADREAGISELVTEQIPTNFDGRLAVTAVLLTDPEDEETGPQSYLKLCVRGLKLRRKGSGEPPIRVDLRASEAREGIRLLGPITDHINAYGTWIAEFKRDERLLGSAALVVRRP